MKGLFLLIVSCALLVPLGAHARGDWRPEFGPLAQAQGQPMKKAPPGHFPRGDQYKPGGQDKGNQGRLTQEERQRLHRDLDRANREIYRR